MRQEETAEPPAAGRWPFAGRGEPAERIAASLRGRAARGVVLAGGPGVGKSRLAAEAVRGLGPVYRIVGTRCGAALPFSAFAGLRVPADDRPASRPGPDAVAGARRIPAARPASGRTTDRTRTRGPHDGHQAPAREQVGTGPGGGHAPQDEGRMRARVARDPGETHSPREGAGGMASVLRDVGAVLRGAPGQERAVLVVDDAHLLDAGSAALVHQLAVRREVRLVVVVRDGEPAPDAIVALWKDDLLPRVEVPPLSCDDLAEVLASALGGHVETRAVRRLAAITGGDLRMVRELVLAGGLAHRDGVWGWRDGGPRVNGRVRELVASRLGDVDEAEWDALTYLAFGASPEPGALARIAGPETVERLEDKGLLTCAGGTPYAEVIRAMCGPVRATRVLRTLAGAEPGHARAAVWRLDGGLPGDPIALTAACRAAVAAFDVPLAVRLGRAALAAGAGEDGTAALSAALRMAHPRTPYDVPRLRAEQDRLTAAVLAGDLTAEPLIGADAEWDLAGAAYCAGWARLHRLRGEARRAIARGRDGAWRLPAGPTAFAGQVLGELAHAAALLGDAATARRALEEARDRRLPDFRTVERAVELAAPWVAAAAGDQAGALRLARAAAQDAADLETALFSLHGVVRLGAAETVTDRLRRLAGGGALAALFARHAEAAAAGDGSALTAVARDFEALGLVLYAAEAHAQAARAHRRTGEDRRASAAAAAGWALSHRCEGARTPALAGLTAPELTARQLEIARLAAAGLSNRAIAERLTVSIRTVANHLCAAYERLGVNDRAGLARLLSGLDRRVA